jgi:hypothetical protein
MTRSWLLPAATAVLAFSPDMALADPVPVDVELSLLIDVSSSINNHQFNLQREGYVEAFRSSAVQSAILNEPLGRIAVNVVYWAGPHQQEQAVGWTLIASAADANAFANSLAGADRPFHGRRNSISGALDSAAVLFQHNGFSSADHIIDISGEGRDSSDHRHRHAIRDPIPGETIDGLPLGGHRLDRYYRDRVVSPDGFVLPVKGPGDFTTAILRNLETVNGGSAGGTSSGPPAQTPEPGGLVLALLGASGLVWRAGVFRRG